MQNSVSQRIQMDISKHPVVLYMKGSPTFPQCGFSARVVQILSHMRVVFEAVDVLQDSDLRDGIKIFSDWPTIPQLYVRGEFIGGCDIVLDMFQSGDLHRVLKEKGISYKEEGIAS